MSPYDLERYARDYILCNFALGTIIQQIAQDKKQRKVLGYEGINAGRNRQHWIPECYMSEFALQISKNVKEVEKVEKSAIRESDGSIASETKNLRDKDFCEPAKAKGRFYSPQFELVLAQIEDDYGNLSKTGAKVDNLWDFIVITTFFLVFYNRTKEQKERNIKQYLKATPDKNKKIVIDLSPALILDLPSEITELDVYVYHRKSVLPVSLLKEFGNNMRFPFTQHPIWLEWDISGNASEIIIAPSFWCVYTPDSLLWIRNKESNHCPKSISRDFLTNRLMNALGGDDSRALYFHPNDRQFWNIGIINNEIGISDIDIAGWKRIL